MQDKLVFKRKKRVGYSGGQMPLKVDVTVYNKVMEIANETGKSMRAIADEMITFAYDNVIYDDD